MKSLNISFLLLFFMSFSFLATAQDKSEKLKVSGECGMCKKKIEKAAKEAGASYALWDSETKELTVKYNSTSANTAKIEKAVAAVGYDTQNEKATDEAYNNLHECCKYERTTAGKLKADCCDKCTAGKTADCCKDGKCEKAKDCCKDGKCEHHQPGASAKNESSSCCQKA